MDKTEQVTIEELEHQAQSRLLRVRAELMKMSNGASSQPPRRLSEFVSESIFELRVAEMARQSVSPIDFTRIAEYLNEQESDVYRETLAAGACCAGRVRKLGETHV